MSRKIIQKVRPPTKKITTTRGQWTADVEGRELAVLRSGRRVGTTGYFDPMAVAKADGAKFERLLAALAGNDVAVLQRDEEDAPKSRDGYVGLFSYKDLQVGEDGSITLTFVDRVQ